MLLRVCYAMSGTDRGRRGCQAATILSGVDVSTKIQVLARHLPPPTSALPAARDSRPPHTQTLDNPVHLAPVAPPTLWLRMWLWSGSPPHRLHTCEKERRVLAFERQPRALTWGCGGSQGQGKGSRRVAHALGGWLRCLCRGLGLVGGADGVGVGARCAAPAVQLEAWKRRPARASGECAAKLPVATQEGRGR
eukprot:3935711-Rhodomonas_salina.4